MASGFNINGSDVEVDYISKSYLLNRYPEIANQFKFAALYAWGNNAYGGLGDNSITHRSSPVQNVAGGANWASLSGNGGSGNHCVGIKTDGTLWGWGGTYNQFPVTGNNSSTGRWSSPVQTVAGGTNWKMASCGYGFTVALKTDGTLWGWGRNANGQLGDDDTYSASSRVTKSSPVQELTAGTNWKYISAAGQYVSAIKTDGSLWQWGLASFSNQGSNISGVDILSPAQYASTATGWKTVLSGAGSTWAIKTNGTLYAWGNNTSGELGDGTVTQRNNPTQIGSDTNWKNLSRNTCTVSTSSQFVFAIKTDGTLWGWGDNFKGQLGTNDRTKYSSPVQTVSGGTNWHQISNGYLSAHAIKTDGTLWSWGYNQQGGIGDGTVTDTSSPVQVITGGNNWKTVAAIGGSAAGAVLAIRNDSMDLGFDNL
jgi:alpha-tubulin suppressor-like RCC1 family protein